MVFGEWIPQAPPTIEVQVIAIKGFLASVFIAAQGIQFLSPVENCPLHPVYVSVGLKVLPVKFHPDDTRSARRRLIFVREWHWT